MNGNGCDPTKGPTFSACPATVVVTDSPPPIERHSSLPSITDPLTTDDETDLGDTTSELIDFEGDMAPGHHQHPKVAPRGVPLSTVTLGMPGNVNPVVSSGRLSAPGSLDGSVMGAKRSKSPRGRRPFSIRNSRFWMRIFNPWRWKKKSSKKTRISRSGSDSSRSPRAPHNVHVPQTTLSSPEHFFEDAMAVGGSHCIPSERQTSPSGSRSVEISRNGCVGNASIASSSSHGHCVPCTAVASCLASSSPEASTSSVNQPYSGAITTRFPATRVPTTTFSADRASIISLAGDLASDRPFQTSPSQQDSLSPSAFDTTFNSENMQPYRVVPIFHEVAASEPDLKALPRKPVLRRPGAPSRLTRRSAGSNQSAEPSPTKSTSSKKDLPSRLTDDSDSDSDIKYRSDDDERPSPSSPSTASHPDLPPGPKTSVASAIGRWGSSVADTDLPRSTNPLIASKIVPRPSMSDSHSNDDMKMQTDDSGSDGDNERENTEDESSEDNEDEPMPTSSLASRIMRKDTMARKLDAPDPVDDVPNQTADERRKIMQKVSLKLERKLSERPLAEELEQRNILKAELAERISRENMEATRKMLLRKLSFRPTIQELKDKQIIKFSDYVEVTEAEEYDRKSDRPWTRLTPAEKALIRKELNDFKAEMDVHADSRIYTRFHR
uniref:Phosphatase and actin regulator n=1 Tax=Panagrellus redivivus TaxID=6233 RepID=A0A7E4ZTD0_PANRE